MEKFAAEKFKQDLKEKLRVEIQRFAEKNIDIPRIMTAYPQDMVLMGTKDCSF